MCWRAVCISSGDSLWASICASTRSFAISRRLWDMQHSLVWVMERATTVCSHNTFIGRRKQWLLFPLRIQRNVEDRKSPRLNSSHLVISDGVFCLTNIFGALSADDH